MAASGHAVKRWLDYQASDSEADDQASDSEIDYQDLKSFTQRYKWINALLPLELLREIFLYSIEVHQMEPGHLASVCRRWRSVIIGTASVWSTLRVGTWTERERVTTWSQRAYPKKVVIDTQRDRQQPSNTEPFLALQDALTTSREWTGLTISSFPPEDLASRLGFSVASPMEGLKALHIAAGCAHSPSFTHLLHLVPTKAPLSELGLHPSFASTHFLQPHWFPVLQNLTVLIVNGRGFYEPFLLLPAFTQLQIFEASHLPLPMYEPNTDLPLLHTLHKLRLRGSSVQWMAGRQFPYLEELAVLLPHHQVEIQQHRVELPLCKTFIYHGYPMAIVQSFHVPQMKSLELRSHDCKEQRVHQQLHHLCRLGGTISKLTILHLALECSERPLSKVLKYLDALQELVVSITYPSPSWQRFLESLAAKPSANDWPKWTLWPNRNKWEDWCHSQTWHANVLPCLNYLGIQCPRGFSQAERVDNFAPLRLVAWTRSQSIPPLQHLKVWEGRGTTDDTVVDYTSAAYLGRHLGPQSDVYDSIIMRGMVTQSLVTPIGDTPLLKILPTAVFRQLQSLHITDYRDMEMNFLSYLEQVKQLNIHRGKCPANIRNTHLPLVHTLQHLDLRLSTYSWIVGRTFKDLREVKLSGNSPQELPAPRGFRVDLPACTILKSMGNRLIRPDFFSSPNLQILSWRDPPVSPPSDTKPLQNFLLNCPYLQQLKVIIYHGSKPDSLLQFVFCDAREQRVWQDIRRAEFRVRFTKRDDKISFFNQMLGRQQHYGKSWREFTVTNEEGEIWRNDVVLRAST